jgi:hypothetical protein
MDWRELDRATVLETNPTQFERLITETADAIFQRRRELAGRSGSQKELRKIAEASAELRSLEGEKLNKTDRKIKSVNLK